MKRRITLSLSEETIQLLDILALDGERSDVIDSALRRELGHRLSTGAAARAARDLRIAEEWFNLRDLP